MKSGYTENDQWVFFDIGPYGSSGHAHLDKLHLDVRAYGSMMLVDSGRFAYQGTGSIFHSKYAPTTRAHNTLVIDNCDQAAAPALATGPVDPFTYAITDAYDYARSSMSLWNNLKGNATHTRAVHFLKGHWLVVVDKVSTNRPRFIQAVWHAHPNSTVVVIDVHLGVAVVTGVPRGQIAIIPASGSLWNLSVVKGQQPPEYPYFQGWFSASYLDCEPSPTLLYDTNIPDGDSIFAWLLLPSPIATQGPVHAALDIVEKDTKSVTVKVKIQGQPDTIQKIALA